MKLANEIGLPVLVRPSYVLGGRAMVIAYDLKTVEEYVAQAALIGSGSDPKRPILIDQFLEDATEVDVDALADGEDVVIAGIMEHIEEAGIHSGDSSCVLPSVTLKPSVLERIREYTARLAKALNVVGLMNVQYAIQRDTVYVLEVNPRASRTIPYVSKATGVPLAKVAARLDDRTKVARYAFAVHRNERREGTGGAEFLRGEIAGISVQQVPRRGYDSGAGDALDGRSDGNFVDFRAGVCEGAIGGRAAVCRRRARSSSA